MVEIGKRYFMLSLILLFVEYIPTSEHEKKWFYKTLSSCKVALTFMDQVVFVVCCHFYVLTTAYSQLTPQYFTKNI